MFQLVHVLALMVECEHAVVTENTDRTKLPNRDQSRLTRIIVTAQMNYLRTNGTIFDEPMHIFLAGDDFVGVHELPHAIHAKRPLDELCARC